MNKAILLSIKPKYVADILNGEKTIEVRKKFPKDYRGWVYIYCTKDKEKLYDDYPNVCSRYKSSKRYILKDFLNGKVVARFYCDNVEYYEDVCYWSEENEKATCLNPTEFFDYLNNIRCHRACYFIHISKLDIFDKPKELSEFRKPSTLSLKQLQEFGLPYDEKTYKEMATKGKWFITKAPQNFCYVESKE